MKLSLLLFVSLAFLCRTHGAGTEDWERFVAHGNSERDLPAMPTISVQSTSESNIYIRVDNRCGIDIAYQGLSKDMPRIFVKEELDGKWEATSWEWCGTGMKEHVLKNNASIVFVIFKAKGPRQVFTVFHNPKNPKEFSLIKLYEKGGGSSVASPPAEPARSSFVYVDGEVKTPSRCTWTNGLTLFQAMQMAGGFTDHARVSAVTLRHDNGVMERVKCSRGSSGTWSGIKLAAGDVVQVPKKAGFPLPPNQRTQ